MTGHITSNPSSRARNPLLLFWTILPLHPDDNTSSEEVQIILKHGLGGIFESADTLRLLHRDSRRGDKVVVKIGKIELLKKDNSKLLHALSSHITQIHVHGNTGTPYTLSLPYTPSLPSNPFIDSPPPPRIEIHKSEFNKKERFIKFLSFLKIFKEKRVLDVAGGQGKLSLLLTVEGYDVTLIDPRPNSGLLSARQRKQLRKKNHPWPGAFKISREFFSNSSKTTSTFFTPPPPPPLVVGIHPDEATEAIVDAAIANRAPFAVVPCCIYSRIFRDRTHNGNPVRTYEQFMDYLQAKTPGIQRHVLDFGGRNLVLYHKGDYEPVKLCTEIKETTEIKEPEKKKAKTTTTTPQQRNNNNKHTSI
ncbi:hypothetical protein TrLO_g6189 [Triparma laevis f. longispina]|uniref:Tellurite resistance methyltransferase TehB-like domain-containing protein n=1 Tax=Triparma laevis f. longispina TaxID=1714387 RepID=A0A9W7FU64_9STRA|nr:hypothetical protein TrLO_g6189 [Triparma laevis f. longispina]